MFSQMLCLCHDSMASKKKWELSLAGITMLLNLGIYPCQSSIKFPFSEPSNISRCKFCFVLLDAGVIGEKKNPFWVYMWRKNVLLFLCFVALSSLVHFMTGRWYGKRQKRRVRKKQQILMQENLECFIKSDVTLNPCLFFKFLFVCFNKAPLSLWNQLNFENNC